MTTDRDTPESPKPRSPQPAKGRDDRLKAALKANMGRRKAQARARAAADDETGGTTSAEKE